MPHPGESIPTLRAVQAGVVDIQLAIYGALEEHHHRLFDWQLREFAASPENQRPCVDCRIQLAGPGSVDILGEHCISPRAIPVAGATYVEWPYYRAVFSEDRANILLSSEPVGLDHAIRGAVVFATMPHRALYFHGASLVFEDQCFLFVGVSGAGKSTISLEGHADRVLCDEISIIEPTAPYTVLPSPFWGTLGYAHRREPAPLVAIALLSHGANTTQWTPVRGVTRVASLLPHVGAQSASQLADPALLAALTQLTADIPVYNVQWVRGEHALNGSPWKRSK